MEERAQDDQPARCLPRALHACKPARSAPAFKAQGYGFCLIVRVVREEEMSCASAPRELLEGCVTRRAGAGLKASSLGNPERPDVTGNAEFSTSLP
jgi:hypothetical protein